MINDTQNGAKLTESGISDSIREKAYNVCKEYLNGAWRLITEDELIIKKIRLVFLDIYV